MRPEGGGKAETRKPRALAMENVPLRTGAFIVGGLFIGFWLYLALFQTDLNLQAAEWWFWGFVGLAIAGGLFGGRVANIPVRIGIMVALGIAAAMLLGAAIFHQVGEAVAALLTAGGGAIIVTALPGATEEELPDQAAQEAWMPVEAPPRRTRSAK